MVTKGISAFFKACLIKNFSFDLSFGSGSADIVLIDHLQHARTQKSRLPGNPAHHAHRYREDQVINPIHNRKLRSDGGHPPAGQQGFPVIGLSRPT